MRPRMPDLLPGNASSLSSCKTLSGAIPYGSMANAATAAKIHADLFMGVMIPKTHDIAILKTFRDLL